MFSVFKNLEVIKTYFRLLKNIKDYRWAIFLIILGLLTLAVADGVLYKNLLPKLVDEAFVLQNDKFLKIAPFYIISLFLIRGISSFLITYFMAYVGRSTVRDFRRKMLKQMMFLPVSFFQSNASGSLISKINYDAEQVAASISNAISDSLRGILLLISMLIVMFLISWKITSLVLLFAPVLGLYLKYISNKMRIHSTNVQNTMGDVTQIANEVVDGYQVIKSFDGMEYEIKRINLATENNKKQEMKMYFATAISIPIMQCIGAIALSGLIYFATLDTISLSAGEFTAMFAAMIVLIRPIKQVASVNSILQKGIAASKSIFKLLDEKKELDFGKIELAKAKGDIKFENVSFCYDEDEFVGEKDIDFQATQDFSEICKNKENKKDEKFENFKNFKKYENFKEKIVSTNNLNETENIEYVLKNINFHVKPGGSIALVGSSGSGKSTIASLLPRFFNVTKGAIYVDDIDIKEYYLRDLRSQIAIVTQDIILFNDTIANNIAYGSKNLKTRKEIEKAAKDAYVFEFADKLVDGLDTMIGENGVKLSGGQRQRIAIARAILKDAPILILDEATSALDTASERYIQRALSKVVKNRTTIIIAHRLSTIENVDQILVIENGIIVEVGSHIELIQKNGKYAKLKNAQSSNFSGFSKEKLEKLID